MEQAWGEIQLSILSSLLDGFVGGGRLTIRQQGGVQCRRKLLPKLLGREALFLSETAQPRPLPPFALLKLPSRTP